MKKLIEEKKPQWFSITSKPKFLILGNAALCELAFPGGQRPVTKPARMERDGKPASYQAVE